MHNTNANQAQHKPNTRLMQAQRMHNTNITPSQHKPNTPNRNVTQA